MLRNHYVIILAIKTHIRKTTQKYVVNILASIKHAYKIDEKNGNIFCREALEKEIHKVVIAFKVLENCSFATVG